MAAGAEKLPGQTEEAAQSHLGRNQVDASQMVQALIICNVLLVQIRKFVPPLTPPGNQEWIVQVQRVDRILCPFLLRASQSHGVDDAAI